jgi:hypothetical protein
MQHLLLIEAVIAQLKATLIFVLGMKRVAAFAASAVSRELLFFTDLNFRMDHDGEHILSPIEQGHGPCHSGTKLPIEP